MTNYYRLWVKWIALLTFAVLSGCLSHKKTFDTKQDISLQVVRQSSGLIHCSEIFGSSIKKLEEENEIFIQTGTMDTADEQAPSAVAVIKVNNRDITLYLQRAFTDSDQVTEEYAGEDYSLNLHYHETEKLNNRIAFEGYCTIKNKDLRSEYGMEGMPNIHDY